MKVKELIAALQEYGKLQRLLNSEGYQLGKKFGEIQTKTGYCNPSHENPYDPDQPEYEDFWTGLVDGREV